MNHARVTLGLFLVAVLAVSLTSETYLAGKLAYYYDVLITIGINVILAVSLNLVNGYTGQFSLGHAGFMAVGAYAAGSWSNHLDPFIEGALGGAGNPLAAKTARMGCMLFGGIRAGVRGNYTNLFWTYGLAGICVYTVLALVNSTYGRGFLTVRDDEVAAEAMGINTTRYKVQAFVVASFFAGIAGALYAHFKAFLTPEGFNFFRSVDVVVMVILGGMGSTLGVILAAFLLTILPEGLRALAHTTFMPPHLQGLLENRLIVYSLLLIVLMLTRPQGLFGDPSAVRKRLTRTRPKS